MVDFYRFTLTDNGEINIALSDVTAPTELDLIKDFNRNGNIDSNDILRGTRVSANSSDSIGQPIEAGRYFVRVEPTNSGGNTNYSLRLGFSSQPSNTPTDPGNDLDTALDILGTGTRSFTEFVGVTDTDDYYRFTLPNNGEINIALSDVTAPTELDLIKDFNGNGVIDSNDFLGGTRVSANSSDSIGGTIEAGIYFVRVEPTNSGGNTNYELRIAT